jgi:dynactin complex subunit
MSGSKSVISGEEPEEEEVSTPTRKIKVGDRAKMKGSETEGVVKFVGTTKFAVGVWVGIHLDKPEGKNNGSVKGVSYFQCPDKYGIFVKLQNVILVSPGEEQISDKPSSDTTQEKYPPTQSESKTEEKINIPASQTTRSEPIRPVRSGQSRSQAPPQSSQMRKEESTMTNETKQTGEQKASEQVETPQSSTDSLKKSESLGSEVTEPIEQLKISDKSKTKAPAPPLKIVERNENLRKMIGTQLFQLFNKTLTSVDQVYLGLNDTLTLTQEISSSLCEFNDSLVKLRSVLPASSQWVDSFLASDSKQI